MNAMSGLNPSACRLNLTTSSCLTALLIAALAAVIPIQVDAESGNDPLTQEDATGRQLQASMIWSPSVPAGTQAYVAFRKTFELPDPATRARLQVFADSRYMLWVNGAYVLRGPCRFNPKRPEFDSVELRPFLKPGSNTLVVLVHHYAGAVNGRIMQHTPGLTARLEVGGKEILRTDASWRCSQNTEYRPSPEAWSSIPDVLDGRRCPLDWTTPAFDDAAWESAVPVDGHTWGAPQPRGIPLARETELTDLKLLRSGRTLKDALPLELGHGAEAAVVVDLGRMAMAYAVVELEADEGSVLEMQYALRNVNGQPGETYGVGTSYTARAGRQHFIAADQWCSRYVTLKCAIGRIRVLALKMIDRRYPFERVGSFRCDDETLTRLWDMAVNTIETVSDDGYGSDARERNEWLQDPAEPNFITTRVALAGPGADGKRVCSDPRLLKNLLRHAALTQLPDGRILATFPTDRGPEDCHYVIEDYSCQWVEALKLYFDATGDRTFLLELWPTLTRQMRWFLDRRTPRGLLLAREYTSFDNPLAYITCEGATMNAYLYQALLDSDYLGRALGQNEQAAAYAQVAKELGTAYNQQFWNEADGAYNSAFVGEKTLGPTAHAQLLALDRGLVPAARVAATRKWLLANYKNAGGFHCCNNPDFERMVAAKSGLNMPVTYYWMFQELYRMDTPAMDQEAISEMRRRWAPMVEHRQDTGTLCEGFVEADGGGGSEACHNYGAVPAYFLSAYVLGVRLDGPVWKKQLLIEPHLGELTNAEGVVVTEFGPVSVAWKREASRLHFRLKTPPGISTGLRLPDGNAGTLMIDGRRATATVQGRYTVLSIGGGEHEGRVEWTRRIPGSSSKSAVGP